MMSISIYKTEEGRQALLEFYNRMLSNWPMEVKEIDVQTDIGNTHILVSGNPSLPPLVLLHGSTSNATTWLGDIESYSKEFCVYAIDMPGEPGKSTETRLSWKNDDYSEWLLQVLDKVGLDKPSLVGLSLGGWAVMKFASKYPERAGNIALIAPGGIVDPNMKSVFKLIKYQKEGESGLKKTLELLFPDNFESAEVVEFFTLLGIHFNARVEGVPKLSNQEISSIQSNVFMLCGANDAFFNFKKAVRRMHKLIPKCETHLFENGSHGLVSMANVVLPYLKR